MREIIALDGQEGRHCCCVYRLLEAILSRAHKMGENGQKKGSWRKFLVELTRKGPKAWVAGAVFQRSISPCIKRDCRKMLLYVPHISQTSNGFFHCMKISYFLLKLGSHFSGIRLQPCWELLSQHYLAFCPLKIRNKLALSFFFFPPISFA